MKSAAAVLIFILGTFCSSAGSISAIDRLLKPLIGERVMAEGLAWGAGAKGLGERLVLPSGQPIYLEGKDYLKKHPNGRLVRLVGRLQVRTMPAAPATSQGYSKPFEYYALKVERVVLIDEVKQEFPRLWDVGNGAAEKTQD